MIAPDECRGISLPDHFLPVFSFYTVFQKSDAKTEITITTTNLIRIKYPLSSFNYRLSPYITALELSVCSGDILVDFVEICNVCTRKVIIKAAKTIINSDKM